MSARKHITCSNSPVLADWVAFFWAYTVLVVTYAMTSVDGFEFYYISSLLNDGGDSVAMFVVRWILWFSVPLVMIPSIRRRTVGRRPSYVMVLVWWFAVVSGIQFRIFMSSVDSTLREVFRYLHYAGTGFVMLAAAYLLHLCGRSILAVVWCLVTVVYCTAFLIDHLTDSLDIPDGLFKTTEYIMFVTFTTLVLLLLTPKASTPAVTAPSEMTSVSRRDVNSLAPLKPQFIHSTR